MWQITKKFDGKFLAFSSASCATFLISWQYILYGRLFGDLLDARFTVIINEHWYRFFTGKDSLTNLGFYFPTTNQLGYSDGFLATGLISIPFRIIGISSVQSWLISNLILIFICLYCAYLFFESLFHSKYRSFGITILISTSYPFLAQFGHLQTVGYLLVFPILLSMKKILSTHHELKIYFFASAFIMTEIFSLTSWYGFVFFISLIGLYGILFLFYGGWPVISKNVTELSREIKKSFMLLSGLLKFCLISVATILMIVWIDIYSIGFKAASDKTYTEFVFYAPRWGDLFNSSTQAWLWQDKWNRLIHETSGPTFERALGFTPVLATTLLMIMVVFQFRKLNQGFKFSLGEKTLFAMIPICILTLITDEQGHSFWRFIWLALKPIRSIRVPFRVSIYLTWIIIYLIFNVLGKLNVRKFTLLVLCLFLFLDSWRPVSSSWSQKEFLTSKDLSIARVLEYSHCQSFFINPKSNDGMPWLTQVDAMIISQTTGISTINGYSGDWPKLWPIKSYWGGASASELIGWIKENDKHIKTRFCYFDLNNPKTAIQVFEL